MVPEITTGLFTICGVLIGGFIGYFSARHVAEINARLNEAAKFRAAFAPALAKYALTKAAEPHGIETMLMAELPAQAAVIEEFRVFIEKGQQKAYQEAWENYHRPPGAGVAFLFLITSWVITVKNALNKTFMKSSNFLNNRRRPNSRDTSRHLSQGSRSTMTPALI